MITSEPGNWDKMRGKGVGRDGRTDSGRAFAVVVVDERLLVSASVWGSFGEETVDILLFLELELVGDRFESSF
jgi:hypothetical protein